MSESMVERVARAIQSKDFEHYGALWESITECDQADYFAMARAAIEAMRQPSDEMINDEDLPYSPAETRQFWQAMIGAALSPAKVDEAG